MSKKEKVKIRLLDDGDYPMVGNNSRTFPVIVNGYTVGETGLLLFVNEADLFAIGCVTNCGDLPFYIGVEAEIVK